MHMKHLDKILLVALAGLLLAACATPGGDNTPETSNLDLIVPPEAVGIENPVAATDESIAAGADIFAANCATCHGPEGFGDGPAGETLDPPPANLHNDHIQASTDGILFWIISNGVEGTAMPAWAGALSEEERWTVVNFVKSLE